MAPKQKIQDPFNAQNLSVAGTKTYLNWAASNCGGISCHGTAKCFEVMSSPGGTERTGPCVCVNPPKLNCPLYFKLGLSTRKYKPYLSGSSKKCTWKEWGALVLKEYPTDFPPSMNNETLKKQWEKALKYTSDQMNLGTATAGVETHPDITPFFKLFMGIQEEIEKEQLEKKVKTMVGTAKSDSMLTFESNILPQATQVGGKLSNSLNKRRSVVGKQSSSPTESNTIDSEEDINSKESFNVDDCGYDGESGEIDDADNDKLISAEDAEDALAKAVKRSSVQKLREKLAQGVDKAAYNDKVREQSANKKQKRKSAAALEAEQKSEQLGTLIERILGPGKEGDYHSGEKERLKLQKVQMLSEIEDRRMAHEMAMMKMQMKMAKFQMQMKMNTMMKAI
mmetsp:Transcript_19398/g.26671  ORF Transcript_19398/g.26671 Transcript_19398/m.26671 type:complete len:395 (-) Transcript_19398:903-2087(-)